MLCSLRPHVVCRLGLYPRSQVSRFLVSEQQVPWAAPYEEYAPPHYEADSLKGKSWADPPLGTAGFSPQWNSLDEAAGVDRRSFEGEYAVREGAPLNPRGRTGVRGRGLLGRWGPNHAGDPVVTRWKRDQQGNVLNHTDDHRPILQVVLVQRRQGGEWALPGGMVDPGEEVAHTAIREFLEEATNSLQMSQDEKQKMEKIVKDFFSKGELVGKSYVDDPRNTDNAWMESSVFSYHDEAGHSVGAIRLQAGDDAAGVRWGDVDRDMQLYASHRDFIERVAQVKHCHW